MELCWSGVVENAVAAGVVHCLREYPFGALHRCLVLLLRVIARLVLCLFFGVSELEICEESCLLLGGLRVPPAVA